MQDFWYVSNIAFALGVAAGEYEEWIKKAVDQIWIPFSLILAVGMFFVTKWGLEGSIGIGSGLEEYQMHFQIGATVIWVLLVLVLASKCRIKEKGFRSKRVCFSWQTFLIYLFDAYLYFYVVCESFGMGYCMEVFDQRAGYRGNFCFMQRFDSYTGDIYFREINFEKIIFAKRVLWYNLSHTAVGRV